MRGRLLGPLALLLLASCTPLRPLPRRYLSLAPGAPAEESVTTRPSLRVVELECAEAYDQQAVQFRVSPVEVRGFRYALWSARPGVMVSEVLRRYLAASGRFALVDDEEAAELELGGRVDVIELYVDEGRWLGRVELVLALRRRRDGRVLWQHRVDGMEEAEHRDVAEVVAAQSRVLDAGLTEALPGLLEAALRAAVGPPAGTSPPPPGEAPAAPAPR